ncbi:MAG: hypothetical protein ORN29_07855 [Rhodoferax sp.]|nr:hypothetical protein [Rhodoferax sp.]
MSQLPFTQRELTKAWRQLRDASFSSTRNNAHRLLLFYSIECGLKAVWLKRQSKTLFESHDILKTGHNLKQILKGMSVSTSLPVNLNMASVTNQKNMSIPRQGAIDVLHQIWRYGGTLVAPPIDDTGMENELEKICQWIAKELT